MLLKAIHRICDHRGTYLPGDTFTPYSKEDEKRLLKQGAAVPVRKTVNIEVPINEEELEK